jgi:beta-lactamase regulating signal transducer with metallopeptidase domain
MNWLHQMATTDATWEILVRTMLHTLWQGAVIALVLWAALRLMAARRTRIRYAASYAAMTAILLGAMLTWAILARAPKSPAPGSLHSASVKSVGLSVSPVGRSTEQSITAETPASRAARLPWTTWAGWSWAIGAALLLARAALGLSSAQRWASGGKLLVDGPLVDRVTQLARRMGLQRTIRVRVGEDWHVPAVMGFVWPTLLLPASLVSEVPAWQLQMMLAHELAHVRRWDYLANFVQQVIEALLFFNPAIWWVSRQIRIEREACCDAWAARIIESPRHAAETLATFAQRLAGACPSPVMAFDGHGELLDRVKRILRPDRAPMTRSPWYVPIIALSAALLCLVVLHRGAEVAVAAAEQLLAPEERVNKIAEAERQQAATEAAAEHPPECTVRGIVRSVDGSQLPKALTTVTITSNVAHSLIGNSARIGRDGHFSQQVAGGEIRLSAALDGYAPIFTERLHPDAKGNLPPVELVLSRGFDATIHVADPAGAPIPGASVVGVYDDGFILGRQAAVSDAAGIVVLHHVTDTAPMHLTVEIPGFQGDSKRIQLSEGKPLEWTLMRASPTSGTVVDAKSGAPIAGAKVDLIQRSGVDEIVYQPQKTWNNPPPLLATTDSAGKFSLTTLRDGAKYAFLVTAPAHGSELVFGVYAGQTNLRWTLGPERIIRGSVTGDLAELPRRRIGNQTVPCVFFDDNLRLENGGYSGSTSVPVSINAGIGTFEIRDPLPGMTSVSVAGQTRRVDPANAAGVLLFDLSPTTQPAKRWVDFTFVPPAGATAPKGKLVVFYFDRAIQAYQRTVVPIEQGKARYEASVGEKIGYGAGPEMPGYWVPDRWDIDVPAGEAPLSVMISDLHPAGAVQGMIQDADGKPARADRFSVSVIDVEQDKPRPDGWTPPQPFNGDGADGLYLISPLLLGRAYRLAATGPDSQVVVSDEFKLEAADPLHRISLRFDPGIGKRVRVLDSAGRPRAGIPVILQFTAAFSWTMRMSARPTDADGSVTFRNVNPNVKGEYSVVIDPGADYQGVTQPITVDRGRVSEIKLEQGYKLTGQLLEDRSGKPLGHRKVKASPVYEEGHVDRSRAEAWTDSDGRFAFGNLDSEVYSLRVDGTVPAGVVIERNAAGQTTYRWPDGVSFPTARGGQRDEVKMRVQVTQ